jgi:AraC-like DNA-binding protein
MKALYEKIVPHGANSFNAYSYEKDEFDTPWHYHPEFELTYIISSKGVRYTGNTFENFQENDFVLLGQNLPHCWKNIGLQTDKASAIVVHFDVNLLGENWMHKPEFANIATLLSRSQNGVKFDVRTARQYRVNLERLLASTSFEKMLSLLDILNGLSGVPNTKELCDRPLHLDLEDHERINKVYHLVRSRYQEKISLSDIANAVNMRRESFSRFFSKTMNKPFFAFLNEYRINAACKMLIESDLQVSQVSYSCGFESLPFFYRQFKKYKSTSPHQYRAAYQKIEFNAMASQRRTPR